MSQAMILAFGRHLVKRNKKRKPVKLPSLNGKDLDLLLRTLERVRGYAN